MFGGGGVWDGVRAEGVGGNVYKGIECKKYEDCFPNPYKAW